MGLIQYTAARRLDRIMDSQGDGTGTVTQVVAATSISGATNATPIVVTANSHGYSDGDFVHITGVVGNTACNDLHVIQSTTTNTFELTTPAGVSVAGNGSYSSGGAAHICFVCKPAAGVTHCIHQLSGIVIDAAWTDDKYMNETALTNGIKLQVRQNTTVVNTLTATPVQIIPDWSLGAEPQIFGELQTNAAASFTWLFDSCFVNLAGDADEFLVVLHSDGLAIDDQWMSVHGEVL
jgi:hypothetical protein